MTACHVIQAQKTPSLPKRQWQRPFGTKIFFALPSRCLPLSHIKEMARGSRDGNIFRSPEKRLVLAQNTLSTDKGMTKGFPDRKVCLGHLGVRLLDTVDSRKLSILCKGMAEHLRDKSLSGTILSKSARRPSTDKEMARGLRDVYFPTVCRESSLAADHGALRQNATNRDNAIICGKTRPITAFHGNAIPPAFSPTPPMRQFRCVVEHKGNV
jgi:hypothetical protein